MTAPPLGCGRRLFPNQYWYFCGETDATRSSPVLCTHCGGAYECEKRTDAGLVKSARTERSLLVSAIEKNTTVLERLIDKVETLKQRFNTTESGQ